jgi:hypothetical protein
MLPTPLATGTHGGTSRTHGSLLDAVRNETLLGAIRRRLLPTPCASDASKRADVGYHGKPTLQARAKLLPTPTATDARSSGTANNVATSSTRHSGTTLTDAVARPSGPSSGGTRLSPRFVCWMMGYPTGWTEIEPTSYTPSGTP